MTKKWGHNAMLTSFKNKTKITCSCGWQLRPVSNDDLDALVDLIHKHYRHTGLIEQKPKTI